MVKPTVASALPLSAASKLPSAIRENNKPRTLRFTGLFVAYLAFVIYGSLVPLTYQPLAWSQAMERFTALRWFPVAAVSRTDFATNFILLIPLAFLAHCVVDCARAPRRQSLLWGGVIWLGCSALAIGVEFIQIYFPPRNPSFNDIVALSGGALVGSLLWYGRGEFLLNFLSGLYHSRRSASVFAQLFWGYALLCVFFQVLPLDLTISPAELYHKWKSGRVVFIPFSKLPPFFWQGFYDLVTDIVLFMPIGFFAVRSGWIQDRRAPRFVRGALWGLLLSAVVEFLQLFVMSRVTDITDLLTAAAGAGFGAMWVLGRAPQHLSVTAAKVRLRYAWLGLVLYCLLLLCVFWIPFNFGIPREELINRVNNFKLLPFYNYFYSTELRALTSLLRQFLFFLPMGVLLSWSLQNGAPRFRAIGAQVCIMMLAFGVELGQLFLPHALADSTDILLGFCGGVFGFFGADRLRGLQPALTLHPRLAIGKKNPPASYFFFKLGIPLLVFALAGLNAALGMNLMQQNSAVPYNVRELFRNEHRWLSYCLFYALLMSWPVISACLALWFRKNIQRWLWAPLLYIAAGLCGWVLLSHAVTVESLWDILGTPIFKNWKGDSELIMRFVIFYIMLLLPMILANLAILRLLKGPATATRPGQFLLPVGINLSFAVLGYMCTGTYAATDNVRELFVVYGRLPSLNWGAPLSLLYVKELYKTYDGVLATVMIYPIIFVFAATALLLAMGLVYSWRWLLLGLVVFTLATLLLWLGLPQIVTTNAVQFLLGPNRQTILTNAEYFFRFVAGMAGMTLFCNLGFWMIYHYIDARV